MIYFSFNFCFNVITRTVHVDNVLYKVKRGVIFIIDLSTFTILVFGSVNVILTSYLIFIHTEPRKSEVPDEVGKQDVHDEYEVSPYHIMRTEREEMLDQRTQRLKEEIAMERSSCKRSATTAEELHPAVHNLPHDGVFFNFDKEEIAE